MTNPIVRSVEFRAVADDPAGDGRTLEGHAAVFNQPTEINSWEGHFKESIAPGAFKKTLRDKKPVIQFDHGMDPRTGTVPIAQIVHAKEDGHGLKVKARMFDNPVVEPIRQAIEAQAIHGMSFRFTPVRDSWTDAQGNDVDPEELQSLLYGGRAADQTRLPLNRTIREVKLHEMGPVVNPAYTGTSVGVRSMADAAEITDQDRAALIAEYKRTMVRSSDPDPVDEPAEPARAANQVVDDGGDDTSVGDFDHFESDVPVRDDGLPDVPADDKRAAKDPKKPYGDVVYADKGYQSDGKQRYPLDTAEHVKAAWDYINVQKNADKYSAADLAKVKAAITAAAPKFGIEISDDDKDKKSEKKSGEPAGAALRSTPASEMVEQLTRSGFTAEEAAELAGQSIPADAARTGTSEPETNQTERVATAMTKEEYEARNQAILARLKELAEPVRSGGTEEQLTEFDNLVTERSANDEAVRKIDARVEQLRALAEIPANREVGSDIGAPAFHQKRDVYGEEALRSIRSSAGDDTEKYRKLMVESATRAIEGAKFARTPQGYKGASSGDVALDNLDIVDKPEVLAKRMLLTGSEVYERAYAKALRAGTLDVLDMEERSTLSRAQALNTDASGGFAVPFQLDPTVILTNAGVVNPIRQLARIEKITGKQWEGVTSAGTTATRGSESSTAPDGSFTLAQPVLNTNRVQVFIPFSYEIDMSWGAIRSEITNMIVDAKEREEDSFITGSGSGTAPYGLLGYTNSGALPVLDTLTVGGYEAADVYALQAALAPRWERNSSWMAHKAVYHKLRQFDSAGGAELWARIGDGQPPALLGSPDYRSSAMSSTVVTGNTIMVLGDFSQFLIVDRLGMNVELVPQVFDPSNGNRPTGQRGVYAVWMNNSKRLVDTAFQTLVVS